ncbi:MAG TPA: VOC family protein [Actinomycetes bacterium]|nr:VOC family protein [Actinomycetes bacterium]
MTTQLLGLRTVIYPVDDLDAATGWWSGLLGIEPYFREPFYVGFEVAGYELGLLPDANPSDGALTYWGVDNVERAMADALATGGQVHTEASAVGDEIVTGTVRTTDGSIVGFIYNPHFEAR